MRILFCLRSELYLRHFHTTLKLLVSRGHEVLLAYEQTKDTDLLECPEPLGAGSGVRLIGLQPQRAGRQALLADRIRGTIDYLRYLHPAFGRATALRARMQRGLPWWLGWLRGVRSMAPRKLNPVIRRLIALDDALPSAPEVRAFLQAHEPDVVLVSPLVDLGSPQVEVVKASAELGIPCGLCVASWDNLTNKGLIRVLPRRVIVWNESQRREAEELHFVPPDRIRITGAQLFDRWFERSPSCSLAEFTERAGLRSGERFLLYCGSSKFIAGTEAEVRVVRRWLEVLRSQDDHRFRDVPVLIRPHPQNCRHWMDVDLSAYGDVAVWPRGGVDTTNPQHQSDYFDSLYYSRAVCGANTSALIEAAIVGRRVLVVPAPEFDHSQAGTVHFQYLTPEHGGFAAMSRDLDEHMAHVGEVLYSSNGSGRYAAASAFVERFIRPLGLARPCDPVLANEIEDLATVELSPVTRRGGLALSGLAALVAWMELGDLVRILRKRHKK